MSGVTIVEYAARHGLRRGTARRRLQAAVVRGEMRERWVWRPHPRARRHHGKPPMMKVLLYEAAGTESGMLRAVVLCCLALALLGLPAVSPANPASARDATDDPPRNLALVQVEGLNLRSSPGLGEPVVRVLPLHEPLIILANWRLQDEAVPEGWGFAVYCDASIGELVSGFVAVRHIRIVSGWTGSLDGARYHCALDHHLRSRED